VSYLSTGQLPSTFTVPSTFKVPSTVPGAAVPPPRDLNLTPEELDRLRPYAGMASIANLAIWGGLAAWLFGVATTNQGVRRAGKWTALGGVAMTFVAIFGGGQAVGAFRRGAR
jgi:hypothetical protein